MRKAHSNPMGLSQWKSRLSIAKILLFSLSVVSLLIGAAGATSHYLRWSWGNRAHPIGWLLSMLFLLVAFAPSPRESARWLKSLIRPRTAFFLFWILFFIVSHLWNFRTAPWNGNALFDESGWDLYFLKSHIMGHPFQPVWPDHIMMARETLFHYYVWAFLRLFGYNILSYEAALCVIWCTIFIFTLLLVHLGFSILLASRLQKCLFFLSIAGWHHGGTVPCGRHTRQAVCVGPCAFCYPLHRFTSQDVKTERQVEFGFSNRLWFSCGSHANPLLHRL